MISYVPEDSFHIKEKKNNKKKSTGFVRKSKGKIKPSVEHLCLFKFQYLHSFVYVAGRLCQYLKKITPKLYKLHASIIADRHVKESILVREHLKHKSDC